MSLAIVTGASKGLGFEVVKALIEQNIEVIGLSRSTNEKVENLLQNSHGLYSHESIDLLNMEKLESLIMDLCRRAAARKPKKLYVINNAGTVEPIERLGFLNNHAIEQALRLNLLAPLVINNTILRELRDESIEIIMVNVTSGAAERPIHGWGIYGATKAAINMHTEVAGLEQEHGNSRYKIIAFGPGIMDTEMQATIRSAGKAAFADLYQFQQFKTTGALRHPSEVAEALADLILHKPLVNGMQYDVNELI